MTPLLTAAVTLASFLLLFGAAGVVVGRLEAGLVAALIIWLVLVPPALLLGQKRDSKLSLKGFFLMFRGGRG